MAEDGFWYHGNGKLGGEFHPTKPNDEERYGEYVKIVRCKDCRWGREVCGNIECSVDLNLPPEYHGYEWFCPNGESRGRMTREEAISRLEGGAPFSELYDEVWENAIIMAIEALKSEPVVRCKDCKWFNDIGCAIRIVDDSDKPKDDDYCSFGERKDG